MWSFRGGRFRARPENSEGVMHVPKTPQLVSRWEDSATDGSAGVPAGLAAMTGTEASATVAELRQRDTSVPLRKCCNGFAIPGTGYE